MKKHALIAAALLFPAALSFGAGYQLNLQGLRQLAMGGGGTAYPWDAATLFYNPGGLARLDKFEANASVLFIMPRVQFIQTPGTGNTNARSVNQTFTPFNVYLGGPVTKDKRFALGVGINTPYGSGVKWDDNWTGRFSSQNIYLQAIYVQPTFAFKVNDYISLGGGFIYSFGHVKLEKAIPLNTMTGEEGQASLKGKANGMGYNLGVSIKANEKWSFGVSYRSRVDMRVREGDVTFNNIPSAAAAQFPTGTNFDATLPLPEVLSVGASFKPIPKLTIQADFNLTGWKAYDTLSFNYTKAVAGSMRSSAPRNYHNRLASRLGMHYQATDGLELMIGGAYDPSPVQDNYVSPDLPDANRIVMTAGFAYKPIQHLTIMAAIEYVTSDKRKSTYLPDGLTGTYQTKAVTPGIGVSWSF